MDKDCFAWPTEYAHTRTHAHTPAHIISTTYLFWTNHPSLPHTTQVLKARELQLTRDGKEVKRYPLMEVYLVDKVCFAWPTEYAEGADGGSKDLFVNPEDVKNNK